MRAIRRPFDDAAALCSIAVLIAAAFADILFFHRVLYLRDLARFFVPNFTVLHDLIRSGAFPFWNPHYNAGQPFAANPAYAALYPPQWIFTSLQIEIVAHYLLAGSGMYLFLRSLGLRIPSSLFGAISFSLGGMMLSLSNLANVLFGVAWFPWLALTVRRRRFALASLILGTILIIGDQATILQAGFLLIAYFIWRREWKPALLIFACGLAVGSAQIIPGLDHQFQSGRAEPLSYSLGTQWMLQPARLLELALPSLFGSYGSPSFYWAGQVPWVLSFYPGLLVTVLAIAGFIKRTRGYKFTAAYFAFSVIASTTPLLYFASFRSIRYPEKFLISGVFVLIVFASITADQLLDVRRTAMIIAIAAVIAALPSPIVIPAIWNLDADALSRARSDAIVTVAITVFLAVLLAIPRVPPIALALFVLLDLGLRIRGLTPRVDASYYDPPPVARALRGARVFNDAEWQLLFRGSPPIPAERRDWRIRNALLPEMQALWGIDSVLENDITLTNLKPSIDLERRFWTARMGHRDDVVRDCLRVAGTTYVAQLRDPTDAANPIRLVPLGHPRFYFANGGRVLRTTEEPNAVDLDVDSNGDTLVIAITRQKYWTATLDGKAAPLQPANVAFQSMQVPTGRHHVAMRYRNPLIVIFGLVSLLSAAALLAAHFVAQHRRSSGHVERLDTA